VLDKSGDENLIGYCLRYSLDDMKDESRKPFSDLSERRSVVKGLGMSGNDWLWSFFVGGGTSRKERA